MRKDLRGLYLRLDWSWAIFSARILLLLYFNTFSRISVLTESY